MSVRFRRNYSQLSFVITFDSPFYEEHTSYWIGASDKHLEGDYRWIDGTSYSYSSKATGRLNY